MKWCVIAGWAARIAAVASALWLPIWSYISGEMTIRMATALALCLGILFAVFVLLSPRIARVLERARTMWLGSFILGPTSPKSSGNDCFDELMKAFDAYTAQRAARGQQSPFVQSSIAVALSGFVLICSELVSPFGSASRLLILSISTVVLTALLLAAAGAVAEGAPPDEDEQNTRATLLQKLLAWVEASESNSGAVVKQLILTGAWDEYLIAEYLREECLRIAQRRNAFRPPDSSVMT